MKVKMLVDMSGTLDGVLWPQRGEVAEVSDELGAKMLANGTAEAVKSRKVETATKDDDTETPEPKTTRTRKSG